MLIFIGVLCFAVGILFLLAAVVSLARKTGKAKGRAITAIALFVVFIITMSISSPEEPSTTTNAKPPEQAAATQAEEMQVEAEDDPATDEQAPEALDGYLAWVIHDTTGDKTNMNDDRIVSIDMSDPKSIFIELMGDDNFTGGMIRTGILADSTDIFERVFADRTDVEKLYLSWSFKLVDMKGNESVSPVVTISMSKDNAASFNWDNFSSSNLPEVADSYAERKGIFD